MTNKYKYPMEAFALAAVLFTSGMKEAMIVGIALIFGDILQNVLRENVKEQYIQTFRAIGAAMTCGAIYLMYILIGMTPEWNQVIGFAVLGLLLIKHQEVKRGDHETEADYNSILYADAIAYGCYVLCAIIKEYLAGATVFGCALPELPFVSAAFGKTMFTLVLAGVMIAIVNRILKADSEKNAAVWVAIPVMLLEVPFVWNNVPEWIGSIVGILTTGVIYLTLRKKLVFSDTEKHIEGVPVELAMLGIIYMIFGLL